MVGERKWVSGNGRTPMKETYVDIAERLELQKGKTRRRLGNRS